MIFWDILYKIIFGPNTTASPEKGLWSGVWWKYLEECYTYGYYCWDWTYCSKNLSKNDKKKQHTCWKFKGLLQSCSPHPYNWSFTFRVGIQILTDTSSCSMWDVLNSQKPSGYEQCAPWQYIPILWVGITFPTDFQSRTWCLETDVAWCCWWCTRYTTDL